MSSGNPLLSRLQEWIQSLHLFFRLLIIGLGCSVITGTSLRFISSKLDSCSPLESLLAIELIPNFGRLPPLLQLIGTTKGFPINCKSGGNRKLLALSKNWSDLANNQPGLTASAFLLVLNNGRYAELNADIALSAGNLIKIPLLLIAMDQIDRGYLDGNTVLIPTKSDLALQNISTVKSSLIPQFTMNQAMALMTRLNNNIVTNQLIQYLGDRDNINKSFEALGLVNTILMHSLPDLRGRNTISVRDLVHIQSLILTGQKLGLIARDLFKDLMIATLNYDNFINGVPQDICKEDTTVIRRLPTKGITVYNKVDNTSTVYAETGLVFLPNNQQIIATFIVQGPFDSNYTKNFIRSLVAAINPIFLDRK